MADNQEINCILEVCCGGDDNDKQVRAMVSLMRRELNAEHRRPEDIAGWILNRFDLAEKGTLKAFKDSISFYARGNPYQG